MQFEEIIVEVGYNCNLACTMCGFGKEANPFNKDKFMSLSMFKKTIDMIAPVTRTIRLNGRGESTIHPDFLEMLNWIHHKYPECNLNLFSNMSAVSASILQALIDANVQLFISLDSVKKDVLQSIRRGANFENIVANVKRLSGASKRPFIVITLQEKNIDEIRSMGEFALSNRCSIIYNVIRSDEIKYIQGFIDKVNLQKEKIANDFMYIHELFKQTDPSLQCLIPDQMAGIPLPLHIGPTTHGSMQKCPAIEKELCILYDGTVTPCNMFNPYEYGSLKEHSLEEILASKSCLDFKKNYKQCSYCKNCANLGV